MRRLTLAAAVLALASSAGAAAPGTLSQLQCASRSGGAPCLKLAQLSQPGGVAVAPDGTIVVTSRASGAITSLRPDLTPLPSTAGISGAAGVAISPDGRDVYVAAADTGVVASYARAADGNLTPTGTADAPSPLAGAEAVVVSPDGLHVYVAAEIGDVIGSFTRNATTGALTPVGCVGVNKLSCSAGRGLDGVTSLSLAPDGRTLYAASVSASAVLAFAREPSTGALTQVAGAAGCQSSLVIVDCAALPALKGPTAVVAGTSSIYVASTGNDAIVAFARDPAGGLAATRCVSSVPSGASGCTPSSLLDGVSALALSPDGALLYASATNDDAVVTMPTSTLVTTSCVHGGRRNGCRTATALGGPGALALSGSLLAVTSATSDSVTELSPQIAPVCSPAAVTARANAGTAIPLACSDANGDPLTRIVVTQPLHGHISTIRNGIASYRPVDGYAGADSFTFAASDGADTSQPAVATLTVTPPAAGPAITVLARSARRRPQNRVQIAVACPRTAIGRCAVTVSGGALRKRATATIGHGQIGQITLQLRGRTPRVALTLAARDGSGQTRKLGLSLAVFTPR